MKLKDVVVGGRYLCKVSGRLVTVKVTAINSTEGYSYTGTTFGNRVTVRARTSITAINEMTGREVSLRSAARLRSKAPARDCGPGPFNDSGLRAGDGSGATGFVRP
jgi:hypothetical protein